ncbi:PKD1L3 [Branchiostoma lanceolatum]|uniref:PKD1L3 protein n=1 Tax=Branchiostoma lanceolatum TaxID=7740 RepID=A0A8J9Z4M0_BRALA|nr:PKD1L3 [Branchiostoma lanceolatum]
MSGVNVAQGKPADQTSTYHGLAAGRAVDGNIDGNLFAGFCASTADNANPSWWVDLGESYMVDRVVITNRQDALPERLNPFNIHIGDSAQFSANPKCGGDHQIDVSQPSISVSCPGMRGRYVGVRLPGPSRTLTLCEVQVFPGVNVALGKPADQTSTYRYAHHGLASHAVDGNTDGNYYSGSCASTAHPPEANPSWWVDLGESYMVDSVVIFNRMDCCGDWLNPFNIHIGDSAQVSTNPQCGGDHRIDVNQSSFSVSCPGMRGRYVGVRLPGPSRILQLCEVQVYPDPCSEGVYRVLNEAWRNVNHGVDTFHCDDGFRGEWFRFMGPAGSVMPTQRPATTHVCGTYAPMWMNGAHPTAADGVVSRQVCEYWSGNPCRWETTIQVKACPAGYYIYKLPRAPACDLAYCGGTAVDPPMNLNVNDITDEGFKVTWSPSPDPDLQGYRVVVSELDMTTAVNQTTDQTWLQVAGLTSETDYIINVTVLVLSEGRWSQSNATTIEATTKPDECATVNGRCDHICSNIPGGYRCQCRQGFVLMADAHGCGVCGRCQGGDVNCDPVSGVCSAGCQDGWKTQLCDKAVYPPLDLAVTDITDEGFKVTWSPSPDPDLEGYRVVVSNRDMTTAVNHTSAEASFPVAGLSPETNYIIRVTALFLSGGWRSQSEATMIVAATGATSTTKPTSATTTKRTSRRTTLFSTKPATSTVREAVGDEGSFDEAATPTAAATTKQTSGTTTVQSTRPATPTVLPGTGETKETSSRPPVGNRATPGQALGNGLGSIYAESVSPNPQDVLQKLAQKNADVSGDAAVLGQPTSAAEEKAQDMAVSVLKSITSNLDHLDMSDPSTVESVGGSLLDSVGSLLEEPERDAEDDGKPAPDLEDDQSLSPKERLEKAEEKEQENQAKRRRLVQESRQVLDGLYNAIIGAMRPGAPPVTIERGGIVLRAQKVRGDQFGGQVVQTEGGSFHVPSKAALFGDYTPHNVAIKNPFTWGRGEYQARSSVMELSLQQNNIPVAFNNLTEDFYITIPGGSGNKPATTTITFPAPGNKSSSYHLLNLTNTAEGFLVTITPLNRSVIYGVMGRNGGRPDDQNYNVSMKTYVLPEECALMKTLSGDEDSEKREATIFIPGEEGPVEYYIKVQIRGPVTECDFEKRADVKESHADDFYAYQIQWARLSCVYWSETQEDWSTDGCAISKQSTIASTICHCNHLTAFGSDFATPPNTFDFGELNFSDLVDNVAVVAAIIAAFCLYFSTTAVVTIAERRGKRMLHHAVKLDKLQNGYLYRLLIWTGAAKHAGTESTVSFKLFGAAANSDVRVVDITEKVFTQNSQVTLTFSTAEQLGNVELLQLMHDNSGEGGRASWNVDRAAVQDLTSGKLFYFFCGEWLAADRGDGQVVKTFPVATEQDLRSFGFLFPASLRSNLAEEHLFLSVAIMPEDSAFTRSERLGCCLSLLLISMVSSAMWLREEIGTQVVAAVSLGPFSFTLNGVYTGVMTSITCLPVIMAIVLLFQYSRPSSKGDRRVQDVETGGPAEAPTQQGPAKRLPHWCKYVAWVLVVLSAVGSAVFTALYSLNWGKDKSESWLSAYFTTFLVDMFLLQPAKPQAVKRIFEEKRGPVSIDARTVSSQKENSNAFRMRRKMERLSMTSLANIKQARMRQRRDRRVVNTFWDIMWFCCCLLIVISIANEHHNTTESFYQTQSTTNTFVQSMDEVNDPLSFWSWLNETALGNFYPETSYKGDKPRWQDESFTADMQSVLVYPPSLIQARVQTGLCTVPVTMQHSFDQCSPAYDERTKETGAFEKGWKRVRNTSAMESEAPGWIHLPSAYPSLPIYGVTTQYWGDGFGLHLGKSADEMRSVLAELKAHRWIDKRTRVVFLEALLYNGNVDLFTSVTMVFEFSETAGVFSRHHVHTFRLHQRPGTIGYIYVLLEIIYVIILLYTLWKEAKAARAAGLAYLMEPWNIVEIFNFILAFTVIALYGFKIMYSFKALMAIKEGKDLVHHFRSAVNISLVYGWILAFLTFVNMMKLLRLVRFNPFLSKLMSVFRGMAGEFCSFILYFFFWLSAFGIYAYLMFGLTVTEYSTISKSFSTLFQMSLGNFYYYQLKEAAPILGPIYFFAFISLIFLVLMNIAMAIIDSALPDVRNHEMPKEDQYFIQGLWERFTAFFGFWKVAATADDSMDTLHDRVTEVEINVQKLWLKRESLFNLKMKDADLPAEPEFVPTVKEIPDAAAVELHVRHRVIKVRPASSNNCTDNGSQATRSENKAPVVVASRSPSKVEDAPENHQTNQVTKIKSILSKQEKSDKESTRKVSFALNVLVRHTEEHKVEWPSVKLSVHNEMALTCLQMLTDDHIQAAQMLLRRQYSALQGLEGPAVGVCDDGFVKMTGKGLQIHHNNHQHWVLSSYTDGKVCLYDSLSVPMTPSLQIQLYQSYAAFADQARNTLTVFLPDVQRQKNVLDCGLFAIAWAVDIAEGQDVSRVVYDNRKMRSHLKTCFKQGNLTPFPRLTGYRKKEGRTKVHQIKLVCHCKQGERLGRMEKCKACGRIVHVSCLPVSPPRGGTWVCGDCAV